MKIAIEARSLSASMGVRTYTYELIRHLLVLQLNHQLTVLYDRSQHVGTFPQAAEEVVPLHHPWLMNWWLSHQVPRALQKISPGIVHFTKAAVPKRVSWPTVVTIYDVIPILFPEGQSWAARRYWPEALRHAVHASDHILTISEASKRDIVQHLHIEPQRVTVTPLAVDTTHFYPRNRDQARTELAQKYQLHKPFVLYVGTIEPRKNIPALVRAFKQISTQVPHDVVIVGKSGPQAQQILLEIEAVGLAERVRLLGQIPYDDLPLVYSAADLFVWPSLYEGWGLPPQEAMACGTPVIVSDGGSLPEVVGDEATIVPFNQAELTTRTMSGDFEQRLAVAIQKDLQLTGDALRARQQAGIDQAKKFTWEQVAQQTLDVYNTVYATSLAN